MKKGILYGFLFILFGLNAQNEKIDSTLIAEKNDVEIQIEQRNLNFEQFFFTALQQKAIGNNDKAISALENCQNIKRDQKAVLFEFGKNYLALEKYVEAENYTLKASELDPDNHFILTLLRDIYNKQNNHAAALEIQKRLVDLAPDTQIDLVILYIKNNQLNNARSLLLELEQQGALSARLIPFKQSLMKGSVHQPTDSLSKKPLNQLTLEELKIAYEKDKSFKILTHLLSKLNAKKLIRELNIESEKAIELFPSQPFIYLMQANAFNYSKKYEEALSTLTMGLSLLVDNTNLEADFYEAMSLSYKGLKQNVKASDHYNKALFLRQNKL